MSAVAFAMALYVYNYDFGEESESKRTQSLVKLIQKNVDGRVENVKQEISGIVARFEGEEEPKFWDLSRETNDPFFIFRNKRIFYWSDYHTAIEDQITRTEYEWTCLRLKTGIYIAHKSRFEHELDIYDVFYLVPLYSEYPIESKYLRSSANEEIFPDMSVTLSLPQEVEEGEEAAGHAIQLKDKTLFHVDIHNLSSKSEMVMASFTGLLMLGAVLLILYAIQLIRYLHGQNDYGRAFLIVVGVLVAIRYFMLMTGFPTDYYDLEIFDPRFYASSDLFASFGDLLLNIGFITIICSYGYYVSYKMGVYKKAIEVNKFNAALLTALLFLCSFFSLQLLHLFFENLNTNSQINYDITKDISVSGFKVLYVVVFALASGVYFVVNYMIFRFLYLFSKTLGTGMVYLLLAIGAGLYMLNRLVFQVDPLLVLADGLYIIMVFKLGLFKNLVRFKYTSYLYLVITGMTCALAGALAIHDFSNERDLKNKSKFAEQLIVHNDLQGQYLMGEVAKQIKQDKFIKDILTKPMAKDVILQKIQKIYLNNYFDKYDINISLYDFNGNPYFQNKLYGKYGDIHGEFNQEQYRTENPELFFVTNFDLDFFSKYLNFITIKDKDVVIGHIVIEYTLKKYIYRSILPKLLQDKKMAGISAFKEYNYAIFEDNKLSYGVGEFRYDRDKFSEIIADPASYNHKFKMDDYDHLVVKGINQTTVVVSSEDKSFFVVFTNFSALFLILILFTFFLVIAHSGILGFKRENLNFSTKIQTYLNIAYFLPLTIVSVSILGIMSSNYEQDLEDSFEGIAENLSSNVGNYMQSYRNGEITIGDFRKKVRQLTKYTESDINLFNSQGRLEMSSQSLIYESKLVSSLMNPAAMEEIIDRKHRMIMLEEKIGDFKFNSFYIALNAPETGNFLGVLNIPFFNSQYDLKNKEITVLSTIINVFTSIFVLILALSFIAFKALTDPLKLIAQKLKRTTFGGENETLIWESKDEIGMLVNEYNDMIIKLEESKKALSRSEKEMAWKEMAKQVAHEIKNPLTPMKLKLQHLLRQLTQDEDSQQNRKAKDAIGSLLEQVDTLSDIATSFSSFAKMPTPENEKFNIIEVLNRTAALYENNKDYILVNRCEDEVVMVIGDEKLMGRIFTNLVINGIQSVSKDRLGEITLDAEVLGKKIIIEIKDNGEGIPEDIKRKVFIPNFSTKYTGSGIGLAVAKRGVEHAGGKIWFETEAGKGTSFFVELPILIE